MTNTPIAGKIYSIEFRCKEIAQAAAAGQFLHIKCGSSFLLRRPVSICSVYDDTVRIVFEVKGKGTEWLSKCEPGQILDILGPLGKGFSFPDGDIIVIGGGIGIPPMLFAAQSAKKHVTAILGCRTKNMIILEDEFRSACRNVIITTEDGSEGIPGMVTQPLGQQIKTGCYAAVMSCGPYPMQKSVAALCKAYNVPCQVSLEERMGCGTGACLVCACRAVTDGINEMSRVCADGPVFDAAQVIW